MQHQLNYRLVKAIGCSIVLATGLLVAGTTSLERPALANGYVNPCSAAPATPANPGSGILTGTVVDRSTSEEVGGAKAVPGAFVVASDNDVPYVRTLPTRGNVASSGACDSQSPGQFTLDLTGVNAGKEFVIGVGAPNGYASQWAPSGDRYLAEIYRKTDEGGFEKRLPNATTWLSVNTPVSISLATGNSMVVGFSVGGSSVGENDLNVTIWGVVPGKVGLTFGGGYSSLNGSFTRVQGLTLGQYFLLQVQPVQGSSLSIKTGFIKQDGANWTLVRDEREATVFYSPTSRGNVKIGSASGAEVPSTLLLAVPEGRTVSGTISSDGQPVAGACVGLFEEQSVRDNKWVTAGSSCAGSDGSWSITGVSTGSYLLWLWDTDNTGQSLGLLPGFYQSGSAVANDPNSATTVPVASANIGNLSVLVNRGKTVSGTISGRSANSEICVNAWREGEVSGWREWAGGTCTRSSSYTISVPAGTYRFEYWDRSGALRTVWASQNSAATSYEDADDVDVSGNLTSATEPLLAVVMSAGNAISGSVTLQSIVGSSQPTPDRGICVSALDVSGNSEGWGKWLAGTCEVEADGSFRLGGLPPTGSVKLRFESFNGSHRSAFYRGGAPQGTSDVTQASFVLTNASNVSIELPSGTRISGTVTDPNGNSVPGACFGVLDAAWTWVAGTCSPDENFLLSGLPSSDVRIWVSPPRSSTTLRGGWLEYSNSAYSLSSSSVTISAASPLSDVTIPLGAGVTLTGNVTTGAEPLVRACLSAFDVTTSEWLGRTCSSTRDGSYALPGLPPTATVKLFVEPASNDFASDWLRLGDQSIDEIDLSQRSTANVPLSAVTGGSIFGRITDALTSAGIRGLVVFVKVQGADATSSATSISLTDSSGRYSLKGLAPGTYEFSIADTSSPSTYVLPGPETVTVSSAPIQRDEILDRRPT